MVSHHYVSKFSSCYVVKTLGLGRIQAEGVVKIESDGADYLDLTKTRMKMVSKAGTLLCVHHVEDAQASKNYWEGIMQPYKS